MNEEYQISDPTFRAAVAAIDAGHVDQLSALLASHPDLVRQRLDHPDTGYFQHPYLLYFIADNPIRHPRLPDNIVDVAKILIAAVKQYAPESLQQQLNYTLGLVESGRIPKECGVQIPLMELLIDEGAKPGEGMPALAHRNLEACKYLLARGGPLTLTVAICIDQEDKLESLAATADKRELQRALMAASFYGKADRVRWLLSLGADPNVYLDPSSGFHHHASALHQAVWSGSLETVQALVDAGANLSATDRGYDGRPVDWTFHMTDENSADEWQAKVLQVREFLERAMNAESTA
ncbi:MAG TPA: ankyrin repeat domain-containing protein [Chitinophagaceae bacterium]